MSPAEAHTAIAAAATARRNSHRLAQSLVYAQAQLNAFAFGDPKRMPKFDKAFPDKAGRRRRTAEEAWAGLMAWAMGCGTKEGAQDGG
jgi:hypothetical protein